MTRSPIHIALLLLALAAASPALAGKAYKCTVDGKTVYQDHPCANLAPVATVAAPAPVSAPPPPPRRAASQVFEELQMAQRHERELVEAYGRDLELVRPRLATMDAKARQVETQQLEARWQPRIQAKRQQVKRLQTELRVQCPGGAVMRAGRLECSA